MILGALPGLPTALAAIGSHVYVVSRGMLLHCDAATTCTPVPFNPTESSVGALREVGDRVYFATFASGGVPGTIQRCSATDCSLPTVLVRGGDPRSFAVHGGFVYYADHADGKAGNAAIRRAPLPSE